MLSSSSETMSPMESTTTLLYKPNNWLAKINFINHLVLFNDVMIVIMAEQGGGKTSFIQLLLEGLDAEISAAHVDAKRPLAEAQVLSEIEELCHLPTSPKPNLSDLIEHVNCLKKHMLIVVDNAHCLKEDFLKSLLQEVNKYRHNFFHVCLASDYTLNPLLNTLHGDTFKDLIHTIELGPLSKKETRKYLLKKLPLTTGLNKNLTDKCLNEFYDLTSGNIAQINSHLMTFFNLNKAHRPFLPKRFNVLASLMIFVLIGTYLGQYNTYSYDKVGKLAHATEQKSDEKSQALINKELIQESKLPVIALVPTNRALGASPMSEAFIDIKQAVPSKHSQKAIRDEVSLIASMHFPNETANPLLKSSLLPVNDLLTQSSIVVKNLAPPKLESHYTIQLLAGADKANLQHFITKKALQGAKIHHMKLNDKDWFILTFGHYKQPKQAKIALQHLPAEILKLNPWIRAVPANTPNQG